MEPEFGARSRGPRDLRLSFFSVVVALILINTSYFGMDLDSYNPYINQGSSLQLLRSGASNVTVVEDGVWSTTPDWNSVAQRPLIHVFNPYVDSSSSSNFYPIGLTQWISECSGCATIRL